VPLPLITISLARYWSPNAWRPMIIGFFQPGTRRGMRLMTIGSRKTVPPRMLRMVPFGESHTMCCQVSVLWTQRKRPGKSRGKLTFLEPEFLNTSLIWGNGGTLHSDGVLFDSLSGIEGDLVVCLITVFEAEIVVLEVDIEVWVDELVLDVLPDDAGHLVAIELDDWVLDLDLLEVGHFSNSDEAGCERWDS
jgi:hypothetical protein